jgi:hypothetical protein
MIAAGEIAAAPFGFDGRLILSGLKLYKGAADGLFALFAACSSGRDQVGMTTKPTSA